MGILLRVRYDCGQFVPFCFDGSEVTESVDSGLDGHGWQLGYTLDFVAR